MLQLRQNSTLNQTKHRFFAHIARNYGYGASFRHCHLTAVSQRNYHTSAQSDYQLVLFDQLCSSKAVASHHYQPKLQYLTTISTIPLHNRVVILGLALMGAVHEHPKNCNFFCMQAQFLYLS